MSDAPDLVERLRLESLRVCHDAADEIERLRKALTEARANLAIAYGNLERRAPEAEQPPFTVRDETPNVPR